MNTLLFQLIEPRKVPWNVTRRNDNQMEKETTEEAGMAVFNNKQKLGHWLGVFATIEWLSIPNAPIWGGDSVSLTSGKGCRFGRGR